METTKQKDGKVDRQELARAIDRGLVAGLEMMEEAVDSSPADQRRWDIGWGAYDGIKRNAETFGISIPDYQKRYNNLINKAKKLGLNTRE